MEKACEIIRNFTSLTDLNGEIPGFGRANHLCSKKKGWSDDHPHADYSDSFADIAKKIDVFQNHFV